MSVVINSDSVLDIEQHFKVAAGPGAGKTHWLVNHIRNTLHKSGRLGKTRKIACITYTNTAVEAITRRLGPSAIQVEVSTIHAFLYKHVVKPYIMFIDPAYGLDVSSVDGHDDKIASGYQFLADWKNATKQTALRDDAAILEAFKSARWRFDASGILVVEPDYPRTSSGYSIKKPSYRVYKSMAWQKGIMHHDDVLFFSYDLIKNNSSIVDILRAKFPYFFIDEFQDTNPIQVAILKLIGESDTIVGIIGDKAQSIYAFQGAKYDTFDSFNLVNMESYTIEDNRRSTDEIVGILNLTRSDISQSSIRGASGIAPNVVVAGDFMSGLIKCQVACGDEELHTLSYANKVANSLKRSLSPDSFDSKALDELLKKDAPSSANKYRSRIIYNFIVAIELIREQKFADAFKALSKIYKKGDADGKKKSLNDLLVLLGRYESFKNDSLYNFYLIIKDELFYDVSVLRMGGVKTYYESKVYSDMASCVIATEENGLCKTIHKAKGDEFDNVVVIFEKETELSFFLENNMEREEHRIKYVAISRAKNRLFIITPNLGEKNKQGLMSLGFAII
ncbi:DNA helicase-2 / ATP-dependent DNA helicase PcrA [Hymenobacter daecheongensis DSM 21074]|uniref:DNA 3'-5' helicase n=1 Tax=Hymenobacter daecheongensis DSM 21074 TaxID=1121955 RepID=A0A1M6EXU9_9BACT|nr:ATP-dependent helicase [Hymenobacter daecheongensis]SHI90255.1 DNA helicase-2 / ATP-dependent DNA helicase PcrA [Hymenobacter daecheongensis DSM 21074]